MATASRLTRASRQSGRNSRSRGGSAARCYEITVFNPQHHCRGVARASLDGVRCDASAIPLRDDGGTHRVEIVLGEKQSGPKASSRKSTARA